MYSFISGTVEQKNENSVVISNNGIGYEIFVSSNSLSSIGNVGTQAKIFTYLYVREDVFALYGFATLKEKQAFLDLMNVSGIGAKSAVSILSGISVDELVNAINAGDTKLLSSIKGIGKKTAERIVLELKGSLDNLPLLSENANVISTPVNDAIEALVGMGILRTNASLMVKAVAFPSDSAETIIQKCLKNM